jgi:hypothetical protein
MSDSSPTKEAVVDKETQPEPFTPAHTDVEIADHGIIVHAAPLARELKGRHMQMIAIGKAFQVNCLQGQQLIPRSSARWCNWSWSIRRFWKCTLHWRTRQFSMSTLLLHYQ